MNTEAITSYIFLDDLNPKGDLAFVFGTYKALRSSVEKSVEIYKKGLAPKIIFSGGFNPNGKLVEGEAMAKEAINLGVPKECILVENKSTNTLENILFSIPIIEKEMGFKNIKIITAVVKNYHARRAMMTLRKHLPKNIILRASSYDCNGDKFRKDMWFKTDEGRGKIYEEVEKIKIYLAKGDIAEL